jgi:predicted nucleic acid-binding protein
MLRLVLDANVFVSAVLKPQSDLARIFDLVRAGKLRKRHRRTPKKIDDFLKKTVRVSIITSPFFLLPAKLFGN